MVLGAGKKGNIFLDVHQIVSREGQRIQIFDEPLLRPSNDFIAIAKADSVNSVEDGSVPGFQVFDEFQKR